jgi:hypothetical protein
MKAYGRVDMYVHVFLTSEPVGVSGQLHVPAALPQGKSPRYTLDTRLGWVPQRCLLMPCGLAEDEAKHKAQ